MSLDVRLPDLGGAVTHAKLTVWLKREGDRVSGGEPIAEVETDKTSVEIEAPGAGVLAKIQVSEGTENVPIHSLLAVIVDGASPRASAASIASARDAAPLHSTAGAEMVLPATPAVSGSRRSDSGDAEIPATPLARRMAYAAGISLTDIGGTGPGGSITKEDVDAVLGRDGRTSHTPPPAIAERPGGFDVQPLSTLRRVTAERLTHAKQTIPHFYLRIDCAMDRVALMRQQLNGRTEERFSFTVFTVRAAALALRKVPTANSLWVDGAIRLCKSIDIAVAVNTPAGLIAPVIRGADEKALVALAREMRTASELARAGTLKPDDYAGGTFTISNLGMYGVSGLYAIINPPQTCILGIGAVEQRPVVREQAVVAGTMMTCTLSADHRALDGATGAELLAAFRELIEDPWALIL